MIERDAIELIQETAVEASSIEIHERDGVAFANRVLHEVRAAARPLPDILDVGTLSALVNYVENDHDELASSEKLVAHVSGPHTVEIVGPLAGYHRKRACYVRARYGVSGYPFGKWLDHETFAIAVRSFFDGEEPEPGVPIEEQPDERARLLMLTGAIDGQEVRTSADDGFSQEATTKVGVAMTDRTKVRNPFILRPFDTFADVESAEGSFILRVRQGPSLMIEEMNPPARAKENVDRIAAYLRDALPLGVLVLA